MNVVILEVEWGPWSRASRWFKINRHNFTGRRLHRLDLHSVDLSGDS